MADLRNDLAKARDAWFESAEGQRLSSGEGIGVYGDANYYLRNRLEAAFIAGWEAMERSGATTAREDVTSKSKARRVAVQKGESSDG